MGILRPIDEEIDEDEEDGEEDEVITKEEFMAILQATIKGLRQAGVPDEELTEERAEPLIMNFVRDVEMARVAEGFLSLIMNGELVITGMEEGKLTFAKTL